jgi:hypothetical protein
MRRRSLRALVVLGLVGGLLAVGPAASSDSGGARSAAQSDLGPAMAAQNRHNDELMRNPDVVGTGAGYAPDGRPAVYVLERAPGARDVPSEVDGVPVVEKVTGDISAVRAGSGVAAAPGPKINNRSRFDRPVPIGVSTGNEGACIAGTIGARVKAGSNAYALSNNHVYALENHAAIGSNVLQPGPYDTRCQVNPADAIGQLSAFEPIVFSDSANNTVDAAIASSAPAQLGTSTPSGGYGTPTIATTAATVGLNVQKYGRTTSLTTGTVTIVNATVLVGYTSGTARFVHQVIVENTKPFLKSGDSGSLVVTDPGNSPVGLLFAGDNTGKFAVANPISDVLGAFGVTVDGS